MLSFATARVNARQRTIAQSACGVLGVLTLAALPFARVPLPELPGAVPLYVSAMFGIGALTAYLLMCQFRASRSATLAVLAGGFLFTAAVAVAFCAVAPGPMFLGDLRRASSPITGALCWALWHVGFAVWMVGYVACDGRATRRLSDSGARVVLAAVLLGAIGSAALVGVAAVWVANLITANPGSAGVIRATVLEVLLAVTIGALAYAALATRGRTVIQLCMLVGLIAACCDLILTFASTGRYTVGWYFGRVELVAACSLLLLVFIDQITATSAGLAELATVDGLTGVGNRRLYDDRLESAHRNALRYGESLGLVLLDVDDFKSFNDAYGHQAGDDVLRALGILMKESLGRSIDLVARIGGEEFAVVLPDADATGAFIVAERIRQAVHALGIVHAGSPLGRLTVSAGVTALGPGESSAAFARRADAALYQAKADGRNRVVRSESPGRSAIRAV